MAVRLAVEMEALEAEVEIHEMGAGDIVGKVKGQTATTVPAYLARTQLGSLLKQVAQRKARFVITKSGKPTAVLLSATDFDDILEELDPEFQTCLKIAAKEYRGGKAVSLQEYLKARLASGRAG